MALFLCSPRFIGVGDEQEAVLAQVMHRYQPITTNTRIHVAYFAEVL